MSAKFMRDLGFFDAQVTQQTSDGGVDVVASGAVAQVKCQSAPVGRPAVQNIRGVAFDGRIPLVYSWSGFTSGAIAFANEAEVALYTVTKVGPVPSSEVAELIPAFFAMERQRAEDEAAAAAEADSLAGEKAQAAQEAADHRAAQEKGAHREAAANARAAKEARKWERRAARTRAAADRRAVMKDRRRRAGQRSERYGAGLVADMRWAAAVSVLGVFCPFGVSLIGYLLALRARKLLGERGVPETPVLLRFALFASVVGTLFTSVGLVGVIGQAVSPHADGEQSAIVSIVLLVVFVAIVLAMSRVWAGVKKRSMSGGSAQ